MATQLVWHWEYLSVIRKLNDAVVELATRDNRKRESYLERLGELVEARQMAGAGGPWSVSAAALATTDRFIESARERFDRWNKNPELALRETPRIHQPKDHANHNKHDDQLD